MTKKVVCYKRSKKDTKGVLKILINEGQKHKYISLKETIPFQDFNPNTERVRKSNPQHAYYNNVIETALAKILISNPKEAFEKTQKCMFDDVKKLYLEQLNTVGSKKTYGMVSNHFQAYVLKTYNVEDIDMFRVSNIDIESFSSYLVNIVGISAYSRNKYVDNLKTIFNYAIKKRLLNYKYDPFADLNLKKETPNKRNVYLNENEIYRLKKLKYGSSVDEFWLNYHGDDDKPKKLNKKDFTQISDVLYNTQLMGLLQIAAQGIRVSDLFLLRPILFENNYFRFKQKKTGIEVNVYLNEYLIEVLSKIIEYKILTNYYDNLESDEYDLIFDKIVSIKNNVKEITHYKFNGKESNAKLITVLQNNNFTDFVDILETLKIKYPNDFFCLSGLDCTDFTNYFKKGKTDQKENNLLGSRTSTFNSNLKIIQSDMKLSKKLTTHIFRHTFANTALTHSNDLYAISKALGHSSITKTETYLRDFDTDKVEALINNTISKIVDLGNYLNFELKE